MLAGLLRADQAAAIAEAAGIPCYVGNMIETGIGTAAYAHFCASTPIVTQGCELFGPPLLADDLTRERIKLSRPVAAFVGAAGGGRSASA